MNAIQNITIGQPDRLKKPVGYTILSNLVNIIPFCLSIEAIDVIFRAFDGNGTPLDTTRLWTISGILVIYVAVMVAAERASYRANFREAYAMSADGRIALAEHLRKLSLGFLSRRDPGDLSSMIITDFTMAETGISHHLPQLMGALVMPVLAFLSLLWINWRMSVAMFIALPVAILILWLSTKLQQRLSSKQIEAKINAGNRMEEYLQGIRVMKAYNLLGDRFVRLRKAFSNFTKSLHTTRSLVGPVHHALYHNRPSRTNLNDPVRNLPSYWRRTLANHFRPFSGRRLTGIRPTDFCLDKLRRISLFFHCRRTHIKFNERTRNERR